MARLALYLVCVCCVCLVAASVDPDVTEKLEGLLEFVLNVLARTKGDGADEANAADADETAVAHAPKANKGEVCPVLSMEAMAEEDGNGLSLPSAIVSARSEHYIDLPLGMARRLGYTEIVMAVHSHEGDANIIVQSQQGHVYGSSTAPSTKKASLFEDTIIVPTAANVTAHAFVVPAGGEDANVTVLLSLRNEGCKVPFAIPGIHNKTIVDLSADLRDVMLPPPRDDMSQTFAYYRKLSSVSEKDVAIAEKLIEELRKGHDSEKLLASSGLEPFEYRLDAKDTQKLWKDKETPVPRSRLTTREQAEVVTSEVNCPTSCCCYCYYQNCPDGRGLTRPSCEEGADRSPCTLFSVSSPCLNAPASCICPCTNTEYQISCEFGPLADGMC
uniref:EGF-like domain-containing protein n=1 Tax=Vitrella brassicaformis TaxID=1169539 RepID=A0A7S1K245_9ALVE